MSQHLTQQELIEFQFDLADGEKASKAAEHLAGCSKCAAALDRIKDRFSALELLREELSTSPELVAATVRQVQGGKSTHFSRGPWMRWMSTAAAVVVIGAIAWMIAGGRFADRGEQAQYAKDLGFKKAPELTAGAPVHSIGQTEAMPDAATERVTEGPTVGGVKAQTTYEKPPATIAKDFKSVAAPAAAKPSGQPMDAVAIKAGDGDVAKAPADAGAVVATKGERAAGFDRSLSESSEPSSESPKVADTRFSVSKKMKPAPVPADKPEASSEELATARNWAMAGDGAVNLGLRGDSFGTMGGYGGMGGFGAMGADPFGKAPFAPASAIELVVLPKRDDVQLTIYNSADLTLVREKRNLTLKKGWNWLQFMWANTLIDPTSLNLEPQTHKADVQSQQLVYPARLKDVGRWLIRSNIEGQVPFEITYLTSGLSWRAFYMGTLSGDEKTMSLSAYVRVANNSGEDYDNAHTRLVVGHVHLLDQIAELARRQYPYGSPATTGHGIRRDGSNAVAMDETKTVTNGLANFDTFYALDALAKKPKEIRKEGLSEYFLYSIEGTESIENQWAKRLLSFEAVDVNVTSLYKYDEKRWSTTTTRFLSFKNDEDHYLGKTPIPNGNVRIYAQAPQAGGGLSYVGGSQIKYIPVGEDVELNLGPARLVKIEPKLMKQVTENYTFNSKGDVSGWDEVQTWKLDLTNSRDLAVDVEVTRDFGLSYWDLTMVDPASNAADAVDYTRHDATSARFKLSLAAHSHRTFGYVVRTYNGDRQRAWKAR